MTIKTKGRIAILSSFMLFITTLVLGWTYRSYVYGNRIFDYHLADTLPSLFCVPCASLLFWAICKKYTFQQCIFYSTVSFIFYELLGLLGSGFFDVFDLIAILLSGIITYGIYRAVQIEDHL
jgi:hypothetical protein